ncbi:conserved hypothetical protein [Talaromyces stipitatus ATCC 10500]|uniref:BZIP domain-containing protein n=1 Tax=Talaromyces stipitatus (strain ATCC 10500 / CBS 375.48 / QM 6759 / NRRL 1006) TaxID=441959 RepID=B8M3C3_TALSN|nr:uncharacterized protein TSTA_095440 [Talaromyces stipitatus ATCC 10500]EED22295.1 conserved hypothetical protein [Talaromyces stipitatus ATCC 10500]
MKSDVLLVPGNNDMFNNQAWFYNDQNLKDFHNAVISGIPPSSPLNNDELSFEHFVPPSVDHMDSPSSIAAGSPDLSHPQRDGSSKSCTKKEKSRKSRSAKTPTSEEDTPEKKSRRRREQNRLAQRTFRERKDRYIQSLESHIKLLDASHKDLQASYRQSTDQINALYTQLLEIQGELDYWRCLAQPSTTQATVTTTAPTITPVEAHTTRHQRQHIPVIPGMHIQHGQFT